MSDDTTRGDRTAVDWLFRNRETGEITIAQPPNPPLWVFFAALVLRGVLPDDSGAQGPLAGIGLAALGWWAVDEVVRGVNPWRRFLGVAGCAATAWGLASRVG